MAQGAAAPADSAPAKLPAWDVVSVKPVETQTACGQGSGWQPTTDGVHIFCLSALIIVEVAYGIMEPSRIVDAPDWAKNSGQYDIDAKVSGDEVAAYGKLPAKDKNRMLQSLLAERFQLKAHMETREMPAYDLVVAKGGPKLKEATADEAEKAWAVDRGGGKIESVSMPLGSLPSFLNAEVGRPVVDKTGLTGKYDFTLDYVPATRAAADESGGPSVFTALEEQLGLKLQPAKEPMEVVVIDHIERPTAN